MSKFSQRGAVRQAGKGKLAPPRATVRSTGLEVLSLRSCETLGRGLHLSDGQRFLCYSIISQTVRDSKASFKNLFEKMNSCD